VRPLLGSRIWVVLTDEDGLGRRDFCSWDCAGDYAKMRAFDEVEALGDLLLRIDALERVSPNGYPVSV
jgi:hypothetical protein